MEKELIQLLENISILTTSSLEPEYVFEKVLDELMSVLKLDAGWIQHISPDNEKMAIVASKGFTEDALIDIISSKSEKTFIDTVVLDGQLKNIPDIGESKNGFVDLINSEFHSLLVVPLKMDMKVIGVIVLCSSIQGRFTELEVGLISVAGAFISFFISKVYGSIGPDEIKKSSVLADTLDKQEFLNALGHELKTPLTALIASAGMLTEQMEKNSSNIQYRIVQNILNSASSLQDRLSELMDLSASKETQFQISMSNFDLIKLIRKVIGYLSPLAKMKNQLVDIRVPDSLIIYADEKRVEQILLNLISNSINYTPEGGQIIVVASENNDRLLVQIQDTGPGIPKKEQLRLFYPYYRVPADRRSKSGQGLGLSITKQLVELHGGTIWVDSKPEKGSVFSFSIPFNNKDKKNNQLR